MLKTAEHVISILTRDFRRQNVTSIDVSFWRLK